MNTRGSETKGFVFILITILIVTFGTQSTSYAQKANPTITASTPQPLTEGTLHKSIVTLTLNVAKYERSVFDISDAVSVSGIDGITFDDFFGVDRVSDTKVTIELEFVGNIDTNATLTFTVSAVAIAGYNGNALTATLPVTAIEESLDASTDAPLTEATLDGSTITLSLTGLTGEHFADEWDIGDALSTSGIEGAGVNGYDVRRVNDTEATVELTFSGNIDEDTPLTLIVGPDAIAGYNRTFTFQFPVTAVEESLNASTKAPLTEATLDGSTITLSLNGRKFADAWDIENASLVSGIEGATVNRYEALRVSDTEATIELTFSGNIDENATLTLTVGPGAIGYDEAFTFQFPVTAVEESLDASTEFPLTEANLNGTTITLSLTGRRFAGWEWDWDIEDALSVSGIDGLAVSRYSVYRVSGTEVKFRLTFSGNMDTDTTLTLTVGAKAINYDKDFTFQLPVTAIQQSNATLSISPASVVSPAVGEQLTFNLNIAGGENIAGYQATVSYDPTALDAVDTTNGDYLPADPFFLADTYYREVRLTAGTLAEAANGDGTLATLTFEVEDFKPSILTLSKVYLVDADGKRWEANTKNAEVTIPPEPAEARFGDINRDGVVNIQDLIIVNARFGERGQNSADLNADGLVDIVDLVLVANALGEEAAAPTLYPPAVQLITTRDVQGWLSQARQLTLTDPTHLRGITVLQQLLKTLTPKKSALLPNYPNPFNPETWIPYHLSNDTDVQIEIYDTKGVLVRRLDLGHQMAGYYTDRTKAAYWDGKNAFGESVASGVYFYHLSVGDYSATRKMLVLK